MWVINNDSKKWTPNVDSIEMSDFQSLKQDLKFLRFYQRVLSASTFVRMDNTDDIYDILTKHTPKTYNYNSIFSPYVTPYLYPIQNEVPITSTSSQYEFIEKFLPEYGLTLKSLFTPKRLIDDQIKNLLYVDVATTAIIIDLSVKKPGLVIDEVTLKEGHRILVKDQYSLVTIPSSTDPSSYFDGHYEVQSEVGSDTTYLIYNSNNGIYTYTKEKLVRDNDLDLYSDVIKYSICVKLGTTNREKQWSLQRLNNGFFPEYLKNQTMYFTEKHNYVLRNRMDYNNLYELVLYDTIKHGTQSFTSNDITYTIPERTITIGEFGIIICHQEGVTNIINSKYKVNLRSISETEKNYWICGDDGTLLKVNKINFNIERIKLSEKLADPKPGIPKDPRIYRDNGTVLTSLTSVSFYNESRGVVVGKYNQIWITDDGGYNWKRINIVDFDGYNFNVALYQSIDRFYLGGDNGVFIDFLYESGNWTAFKRRVSKFIDADDEYLLVDDITDLEYFTGISGFTTSNTSFIAISAKQDNLYLYDIQNSLSDFSFVFLGNPTFSDISSIKYVSGTSSLFLSTFEYIYKVNPLLGTFSSNESNIFSVTYSSYYTQSGINCIYNYNDDELIITGNNSLWEKNVFPGTFSSIYDDKYYSNLKPRLLFMDYDAGSRLYWFDDYGQYRLPSRYVVPVSYLIDSTALTQSAISFKQNTNSVYDSVTSTTYSYFDNNWITYWKDRLKTFEYYTHLSDGFKVEPSFDFKSSDYLSGIFTYSLNDLTIQYGDIQGLMPSVSNRYREQSTPISVPATSYALYFYKFLGIWAITINSTESAPEKGDVIYIDCSIFSGRFIINKVFSDTSGPNTTYYQYFYTDFNDNILNNLNNLDGYIEIRNLNRYPTKKGGVKSFTATYSTSGYAPGSYVSIETSSTSGSMATFDIEVNGARSISAIVIKNPGFGYTVGDVLTIPTTSQVGGPTDITITITELDYKTLFIDNFKKHYIYYGYDIDLIVDDYAKPLSNPIGVTQSFQITGKYSQYSAYYNLQASVGVLNTDGLLLEDDILYPTGFLNFGYTPTYNLLSYLNFLNPSRYKPSKEFLALPHYDNIPGPNSGVTDTSVVNDNLIYFDFINGAYSGKLETNKLFFGLNLKPLWDSFMKWTFVDLTLKEGSSWPPPSNSTEYSTKRLIIIDKYYDDTTYSEPYYVIVFHDKFEGNNSICALTIHSRRTLQQISDDLQYINRLQRPYEDSEGTKWSEKSIEPGYSYTNYETDINFKIPTDSYTKVLLSDSQIFEDLSGIVYTDYKNELAVQITKLENEFELPIVNVLRSVNNKYQLSFSENHGLIDGNGINIEIVGTFSNWPNLLGYHVINYLDDTAIEIDIPWTGFLPQDKLVAKIIKKDPFLNFQPIDIFDLGVGDKKVKQSIQILENNYDVTGSRYYLKNIDFNKYRFRLIDGLDLVRLTDEFFWILDAEVSEAIIGVDNNQNLIWYEGIWEGGRWFGGTWISGTWKSGDWYDGVWTSKIITDNLLTVKVDNSKTDEFSSLWYGGRWFGGTWQNGTWYSGRWYGGTWQNGRWFDGTWNDGTWNNGIFSGGIWVLGTWNKGLFNTNSSLSYWLDGKFLGGDFENGIWYNGEFNQTSSLKSRFGTKSFNSRNSIWNGGKFLKGEFHSFLNENDQGLPDVSEIHKYSTWYTGVFSGGVFYGGNTHNINFNSSLWQGGISNDINIISIKSNSEYNQFGLDGIYRFNIGDIFYIVDNFQNGTYSVFGTTENPKKYFILDTTINEDTNTTEVFVDVRLSDIMSVNTTNIDDKIDTDLKCVSIFKDSTWNSGIWFNGVFDEGYYNGGMWYHGNFSGIWG
jgi:hypothetical protein